MSKGISLHIGLNHVDPASYSGWTGDLNSCEFDANDLAAICAARGFQTNTLITESATSKAVLAAINAAAAELAKGDLFLISYSGHGGQMADTSGDESDRLDETWVLYDRQLLDDELYQCWARFAAGVRIVVLSDSCHSGSIVKAQLDAAGSHAELLREVFARGRFMPKDVNDRDNDARETLYGQLRATTPGEGEAELAARVLLLSGCQENQTAADGERNGLFTARLIELWGDGANRIGYRKFLTTIKGKMPPWQSPNFLALNDPRRAFNRERPFTP